MQEAGTIGTMSAKRRIGSMLLGLAVALTVRGAAAQAPAGAPASPDRAGAAETLKERLSDKASDEQRVDNCKVPKERRGPKPRPEGCAEDRAGKADRKR